MTEPRIVSHEEWLAARKALLAKEKEFTRLRDELSRERRELPWERVEKAYAFDAPEGRVTPRRPVRRQGPAPGLSFHVRAGLERGLSELLVLGRQLQRRRRPSRASRHRAGGGVARAARQDRGLPQAHGLDVPLGVVAPQRLQLRLRRLVRQPDADGRSTTISARLKLGGEETPGISAFRRGDDGAIYHTYSTYARGLDMLNGAYHLLDLTSKGRDEDPAPPMAWVSATTATDVLQQEGTMAAIKIYGVPPSTFTRTVLLACHEKGIDYELVPTMPGPDGGAQSVPARSRPSRTAISRCSNSTAILRYLDRTFPGPKLWPEDFAAGARCATSG